MEGAVMVIDMIFEGIATVSLYALVFLVMPALFFAVCKFVAQL